jgi:hypothetical protein
LPGVGRPGRAGALNRFLDYIEGTERLVPTRLRSRSTGTPISAIAGNAFDIDEPMLAAKCKPYQSARGDFRDAR